jgi:uncharacterized repeat protein (TIGR04138 family)
MLSTNSFEQTLERIVANDPRYHRDAYQFVREALDVAQKKFCEEKREPQHVSGRQLLDGVKDYALEEFGPMTLTVFGEWGIHNCQDVGDIVFNMVEHTLLGKTEEDTRADFKDAYDFREVFEFPFLPKNKKRAAKRTVRKASSKGAGKQESK